MSAKIVYKDYNQNESLLFPPTLGELVPKNHPVRIVNAVIDRLDISSVESTYKGGGTSSFHPRMLLKVIVYSYLCNVYSGRRMERLLQENVNYMWLSGMSRPDFRTINRFRSERLADGPASECGGARVAESAVHRRDEDRVCGEQVHFRMERECREEQGATGGEGRCGPQGGGVRTQ